MTPPDDDPDARPTPEEREEDAMLDDLDRAERHGWRDGVDP